MTDEKHLKTMQELVLGGRDPWWWPEDEQVVPEKLRPLRRALGAAMLIGHYAERLGNPQAPEVLFLKRSIVEEIEYEASRLADPEVAAFHNEVSAEWNAEHGTSV